MAPTWVSPTESGNPNTARAPAATAAGLNAVQPRRDRVGEIRFDDRDVLAMGVDARPLAERVLQLLDRGC